MQEGSKKAKSSAKDAVETGNAVDLDEKAFEALSPIKTTTQEDESLVVHQDETPTSPKPISKEPRVPTPDSPERAEHRILSDLRSQKQEVLKYLDDHSNFHAEVRQQLGGDSLRRSDKRSTSSLMISVRNSFVNTRHDEGTKLSEDDVEQETSSPLLLNRGRQFSNSSTDTASGDLNTTNDILDHSHHHLNIEYGTNLDSFDTLWEEYKASVIERKMENVTKMQNALQMLNSFRNLIVNSSATSHELTDVKERNDDLIQTIENLKTNLQRIAFDEETYQNKVLLWKTHATEKDKLLLSTLKREENRVHQLRDLLLSREVMESRKWDHLNLMFKICNDYHYNPDTIYRCFLCTEKLYHFYYHRLHEWKQFRYSLAAEQVTEQHLDQFLSNNSDVYHEEVYLKKYHMQQLLDAIRNDARSEMAKHLKKNVGKSSFEEYSYEIKDNSQRFDIGERGEDMLHKKYNRIDIGVQYTFRDRAAEKDQRELKEKLDYTTKLLEQKDRLILERAQDEQDRLSRNLSENTKPIQCTTPVETNDVEVQSSETDMSDAERREGWNTASSTTGGRSDSMTTLRTAASRESLTSEKTSSDDGSQPTNMSSTPLSTAHRFMAHTATRHHMSDSVLVPSGLIVKPIEYSVTNRQPSTHDSAESPRVQTPDDTISDRLSRRASWKLSANSTIDQHIFTDLQNEIKRLTAKLAHYEADNTLEERKEMHRLQQDVKYLQDRLRIHEGDSTEMPTHSDSSAQTTAIDTGIYQAQGTDEDEASHTNPAQLDDLLSRASTQLNLMQSMDIESRRSTPQDGTHRTIFSEINGLPQRKRAATTTSIATDIQTPVSINPHEIYYLQDRHIAPPGVFKAVQVSAGQLEHNKRDKLVQTKIKGVPESKKQKRQDEKHDAVGPVAMVMVEVEHLSDIFAHDDEVASKSLEMYNTIVQSLIAKFEGNVIKQYHATGGYICAFPKVVEGVRFALSLMKKLNNTSWPPDLMYVDRCRVIKDDKQGGTLLRGFRVSTSILSSNHSILGKDLLTKAEQSLMESLRQLLLLNKKAQGGLIVISNDVYSEIKLNMFLANELYISKSLKSNLRELQAIAPLRIILPQKLQGRHELVIRKQQKSKETVTSKMLKKSRDAGYKEKITEAVNALNAMNKKDKRGTVENRFVEVLMNVRKKNKEATPQVSARKHVSGANSSRIPENLHESAQLLQRLEAVVGEDTNTQSDDATKSMLADCHRQLSVLLRHIEESGDRSLLDISSGVNNGLIDLNSTYHHKTPKLLSLSKRMGYSGGGGVALGMLSSTSGAREQQKESRSGHSRRRPSTAAVDPRHVRKLHM